MTIVDDEGLAAGGCGKLFIVKVKILEAKGGIPLLLLEGDLVLYLGGVS